MPILVEACEAQRERLRKIPGAKRGVQWAEVKMPTRLKSHIILNGRRL